MTVSSAPAASAHSPAQPASPSAGPRASVLVALGVLSAIAPFATDMYLSAFPQMTVELSSTASQIQLSLTAFFVGAGAGQLVFGPLSDRIGRMRPLVVGVAVFLLGSIASALAPTLAALVAARFLQGIGGSAGMVISRSMLSDVAHGRAAARALSLMMLIGGVAPVLAPVVGSLLAESIGWRGLLWILVGLGVVALVLVLVFLRETRTVAARRVARQMSPVRSIRALGTRGYVGSVLTFAFAFASMMAYISASPFVYQDLIGLSTPMYGVAFGLAALGLMACGATSARLVARTGRHVLISRALTVSLVAIAAEVVLVLATEPSLWWIAPIVLGVAPLGFIMGNVTSFALDAAGAESGMGSAVLGLAQFVLAGAVAPLVGIAGEGTALPMALTMLGASLVANLAFRTLLSPEGA